MKIKAEELTSYLVQTSYPVYLITGDEPLLITENSNLIWDHFNRLEHWEKISFHLDSGLKGIEILDALDNRSLFAEKTMVELRTRGKLSDDICKTIQKYLDRPSPNNILLIVTNRLDTIQQKSSWFKTIDAKGLIVQIWPISSSQFPQWLQRKAKMAGLIIDHEGLQLLAEYTAGNLLAANQEIAKLVILYGGGRLEASEIKQLITDSARFNSTDLIEATLSGNFKSIHRIINNLKQAFLEPNILLWSITNELRILIGVVNALKKGEDPDKILAKNRIFYQRKVIFKKIIGQIELAVLYQLLRETMAVEFILKGIDSHYLVWHELEKVYMKLADLCVKKI